VIIDGAQSRGDWVRVLTARVRDLAVLRTHPMGREEEVAHAGDEGDEAEPGTCGVEMAHRGPD